MVKALCLALCCFLPFSLQAEERSQRYFLFIGEPNATAWKYLMDNPAVRVVEVLRSDRADAERVDERGFEEIEAIDRKRYHGQELTAAIFEITDYENTDYEITGSLFARGVWAGFRRKSGR